jgi:hypothetical protein
MVRIHPDPPPNGVTGGAIAQLGERLLCKQEVIGSIPIGSTSTSTAARNTSRKQQSASRSRGAAWCFFAKHDRLLFNNLE